MSPPADPVVVEELKILVKSGRLGEMPFNSDGKPYKKPVLVNFPVTGSVTPPKPEPKRVPRPAIWDMTEGE
jgi:hypothetical protein